MIKEVVDKFTSWAAILEKRLEGLEGDFFGGKKICIGDFMVFSFFCSAISNENVNHPPLRDACGAILENYPNITNWHDHMA